MPTSAISVDDDERLSIDLSEGASIEFTDREFGVQLTPRYVTFKKLEVVTSRRINAMAALFNITSFVALAVSATVIMLARLAFNFYFADIPALEQGTFMSISVYEFPPIFTLVDSIANFCVFAYAVILLVFFAGVLVKSGRPSLLNEQVWVLLLLTGTTLYLNPHEASVRLQRDYLKLQTPEFQDGFSYIDIFTCLRMLSFSTISLMYIWLTAHSYRYLAERVSYKDWRFYLPKVAVILIYNAYKLFVLFRYRIVFSELPIATCASFLYLYASIDAWPRLGVITVTTLTALEVVVLSLIATDAIRTYCVLRTAEYVKHRTHILGFRFFLHQQTVFYSVYTVTYCLMLFGLPHGQQILNFVINAGEGEGRGSYFDVQYAPLGLHLCILAYVTTETYVNLPASFAFEQLRPYRAESAISNLVEKEPIVYRNREPPSTPRDGLQVVPNCFIMQTNIELFNFSWYVYYHGTQKEDKLKIDFNSLSLKIQKSLHSKITDTKALVAASADRIVVTFKGTTSSQNLLTDLKVTYRSLFQLVNSRATSQSLKSDRISEAFESRAFKRAKVHAGFVDAYNAIQEELLSTIEQLLQEKVRPIFFTGHSLGGALATLASFDVSLSLDVPAERTVVTTFGSPRVGNRMFQEVYDTLVPMNWRVVAGGDIVSRLPKIGYTHVGKKVFLTSGGDLFIDPCALDMVFWHSQSPSLVHHRKSCYLLALKSWCGSRESDYVPQFWPFPVSANDSRKFDTSFRAQKTRSTTSLFSTTSRRGKAKDPFLKYKAWADAIDGLEAPIKNEASILLWRQVGAAALKEIRQDSTTIPAVV